MNALRSLALAVGLVGGSLALTGAASAAPVAAGLGAATAPAAPVEQAQVYFGFGAGPGYYGGPGYGYYGGPRRYYGAYGPGYGYYGGPRRYRPRIVCRVRYTPYGPREICRRRW